MSIGAHAINIANAQLIVLGCRARYPTDKSMALGMLTGPTQDHGRSPRPKGKSCKVC